MSNYGQIKSQGVENITDDDVYENIPKELRILIKRAFSEAVQEDICDADEEVEDTEIHQYSRRHKIRMNRIFRERAWQLLSGKEA